MIHPVGAQRIAAIGIGDGDLDSQRFLIRAGMSENLFALRHIVHEVIGAVDTVGECDAAGEVVSLLGERDLRRAKRQAPGTAGGHIPGPGHLQQAERPIEQIFIAGPASDPVAVDIEV